MPVPKRKRSRARRDSRHANKFIKAQAFSECSNCQEAINPHAICTNCGFYKGQKIMKTKLDRVVVRAEVRAKQKNKSSAAQGQPIDTEAK